MGLEGGKSVTEGLNGLLDLVFGLHRDGYNKINKFGWVIIG